jgi:hypothetical protein
MPTLTTLGSLICESLVQKTPCESRMREIRLFGLMSSGNAAVIG